MPSGKRFKFAGSEIRIMTGYSEDSPNHVISGITNANPAVVTSNAHGLGDGDVVKLTNIEGMEELNDGVFVVVDADANSFALANVNSTDYEEYVSGGVIDVATFSNFCELTGYNRAGGSKPESEATSLCSDAAEYELGLRDFGTTTLDFNFAPRTTVQGALADFDESGDKLAIHIVLPNNGGEMVQIAFVQSQSEQAARNGLWTASATLRNTGARVDIAAA